MLEVAVPFETDPRAQRSAPRSEPNHDPRRTHARRLHAGRRRGGHDRRPVDRPHERRDALFEVRGDHDPDHDEPRRGDDEDRLSGLPHAGRAAPGLDGRVRRRGRFPDLLDRAESHLADRSDPLPAVDSRRSVDDPGGVGERLRPGRPARSPLARAGGRRRHRRAAGRGDLRHDPAAAPGARRREALPRLPRHVRGPAAARAHERRRRRRLASDQRHRRHRSQRTPVDRGAPVSGQPDAGQPDRRDRHLSRPAWIDRGRLAPAGRSRRARRHPRRPRPLEAHPRPRQRDDRSRGRRRGPGRLSAHLLDALDRDDLREPGCLRSRRSRGPVRRVPRTPGTSLAMRPGTVPR